MLWGQALRYRNCDGVGVVTGVTSNSDHHLQKSRYPPRRGNVLGPSAKISFSPAANGSLDPSAPRIAGSAGGGSYAAGTSK